MSPKEKVTPLELAEALLRFGPGPKESAVSMMKSFPASIDREYLLDEILYLRVFTVCFAVSMTLDNTPVKEEVLNFYYGFLWKMSKESISGVEVFKKGLENRLLKYTEAVKRPHPNGPGWTVGKTFSDLCGGGMNIKVIMLGSAMFVPAYKGVSDIVKASKIVG